MSEGKADSKYSVNVAVASFMLLTIYWPTYLYFQLFTTHSVPPPAMLPSSPFLFCFRLTPAQFWLRTFIWCTGVFVFEFWVRVINSLPWPWKESCCILLFRGRYMSPCAFRRMCGWKKKWLVTQSALPCCVAICILGCSVASVLFSGTGDSHTGGRQKHLEIVGPKKAQLRPDLSVPHMTDRKMAGVHFTQFL